MAYDDEKLRRWDRDTADVLESALKKTDLFFPIYYAASIGVIDIILSTVDDQQANYNGYTDVVYRTTKVSFFFSAAAFDLARAKTEGLAYHVVLNVAHRKTTGSALATLIHEFGVHVARMHLVIKKLRDPSQKSRALILKLALEDGSFNAQTHHEEFADTESAVFAALDTTTRAQLDTLYHRKLTSDHEQYCSAITDGQSLHVAVYGQEALYRNVSRIVGEVEKTSNEFASRATAQRKGLLGWFLT